MIIIAILAIVGLSGGGYFYYGTAKEIVKNTGDLEEKLLELENNNMLLAKNLSAEKQKNKLFEDQINDIAGTVGSLDKLSKTDKELLQKYSVIYFLNEHYVPDELSEIPDQYIYNQEKTLQIHSKVLPDLEKMIDKAAEDGINLKIISAYRSFGQQSALKNTYLVTYGSGSNKFSADQGYSEHQLGTTIDLTTAELGSGFTAFGGSEAFEWMKKYAYRFGFVLSYPEGNAFYQYEPWHWRFVGENLARRLHEDGKYFYDLSQPTIDLYLISIFD